MLREWNGPAAIFLIARISERAPLDGVFISRVECARELAGRSHVGVTSPSDDDDDDDIPPFALSRSRMLIRDDDDNVARFTETRRARVDHPLAITGWSLMGKKRKTRIARRPALHFLFPGLALAGARGARDPRKGGESFEPRNEVFINHVEHGRAKVR